MPHMRRLEQQAIRLSKQFTHINRKRKSIKKYIKFVAIFFL